MADSRTRLDESFSAQVVQKGLTGTSTVAIDLSKISISPTGQVQPASQGSGSGGTGQGGTAPSSLNGSEE